MNASALFAVPAADTTGPTIQLLSPVLTPRNVPVATVNVTFSEPIDPATFTTAALTLVRDGTVIPLTSGITFTTFDNVTFAIGGLSPYTNVPGSYGFTVNAATIKDPAGNSGTGLRTISFVIQSPVVEDTGPKVTNLQWYGLHGQPSVLVLTFDRPLDPIRAGIPSNYRVIGPHGASLLINAGVYNATNNTVTLMMAKQLGRKKTYQIEVIGVGPTAILDVYGIPLDGAGNGTPGTNYVANFNSSIIVGPLIPTTGPGSALPPTVNKRFYRYVHYKFGS